VANGVLQSVHKESTESFQQKRLLGHGRISKVDWMQKEIKGLGTSLFTLCLVKRILFLLHDYHLFYDEAENHTGVERPSTRLAKKTTALDRIFTSQQGEYPS